MKVKSGFVLAAIISLLGTFLLGGCATFDGFRLDVEYAIGRMPSEQGQTPSEACEPIYRREGASPLYKQCLAQRIEAGISEEDQHRLFLAKAYPTCSSLYRDRRASLHQYRKCQIQAFVQSKVEQLVTLRIRSNKQPPRTGSRHGINKRTEGQR